MRPTAYFVCSSLLLACSSGSSTDDGGTDASSSDASLDVIVDAPAEAFPTCDTTKPFGAPVAIAELNTAANDLFPRMTHDELSLYFERYASADAGVPGQQGGSDLLVATRASVGAPFGAPTLLKSINTAANDFDPTVTGDALTIFFASNRGNGVGNADLWMATRADTTSAFGTATNVAPLNTVDNEHTPYVLANGLTLYYTGSAGSALERATRTSTTTPFAPDTSGLFGLVNTTNAEVSPVVTPDELTLYFGSQRSGSQMLDVYVATRASTASPFGSVARVAEVSTATNDVPTWISDDGCRLYMHSDTAGSYDLYVATKP